MFFTVMGISVILIITAGVCFMIFHGQKNGNDRKPGKKVTDIEFLNLRISGMRGSEEYEIIVNGGQAEISYYTVRYIDAHDERVLEKRAVCNTQTVIDALNSFNFIRWNGFHGKHPKGVLDGRMFSLTARLNGGQTLSADGSENFPDNFREFERWLNEKLNEDKQ